MLFRSVSQSRYPVDKKITEAKRIKHKINKEYWDKGAVKISAYKPKPIQEIYDENLIVEYNVRYHTIAEFGF